jgi:urease accessory protein
VTPALSWRVLQVADSAFPTGGFAHSAGLEAAIHLGEVKTAARLDGYLRAHLWNVAGASLPFVAEAHERPGDVWALDARVDAFVTNHVANRASRTQGRTFAATCASVFDEAGRGALAAIAAVARTRQVTAHWAPVFGAALAALGIERHEALSLHMYLALRGTVSAALRLGIVGPHEAQRLLERHMVTLDAALAACAALRSGDAATTAPLFDVFGATHDRLYARLFQS